MTLELYERVLAEKRRRLTSARPARPARLRGAGAWHPEVYAAPLLPARVAPLRARPVCHRHGGLAPGTLAQLAGAGGCVSLRRRSAAHPRAASTTPAPSLSAPTALALRGRDHAGSLTTFSVAPGNGLIEQLNLGAGCLASIAQDGCGAARALEGASSLVVSPDSLHVYAASATPERRDELRRQPNGRSCSPPASPAASTSDARSPAARARRRSAAPTRSRSRPTAISSTSRAARPTPAHVLARCGDRAPDAARGHAGCLRNDHTRLHAGHRPRRARRRSRSPRTDLALRRLGRGHADGVPARRRRRAR